MNHKSASYAIIVVGDTSHNVIWVVHRAPHIHLVVACEEVQGKAVVTAIQQSISVLVNAAARKLFAFVYVWANVPLWHAYTCRLSA